MCNKIIFWFLIFIYNFALLSITQEMLDQVNKQYPEIKAILGLSDISSQILNIYKRDPITKDRFYENGQGLQVGYLRFLEKKDRPFSLEYIEIDNQFQGKGFAKAALKLFFKLLDSMNVAYVNGLLASGTPYAGKLYAEVGFEYDPDDISEKLMDNIDPMELVKNNKATEIDLKMKRLKDTPLENNMEKAFIRGYAIHICKEAQEYINIDRNDLQYTTLMSICSAIRKKKNDVILITDIFQNYYNNTNDYYKSLLDKTFSRFTCNDRPCNERLKGNI